MRPSSPDADGAGGEQGSAVVEFTFLSLLLMVPLVYFIITMGQLQGGSFAVVGAADQAAKVFVAQPDAAGGRAAAEQAVLAGARRPRAPRGECPGRDRVAPRRTAWLPARPSRSPCT